MFTMGINQRTRQATVWCMDYMQTTLLISLLSAWVVWSFSSVNVMPQIIIGNNTQYSSVVGVIYSVPD